MRAHGFCLLFLGVVACSDETPRNSGPRDASPFIDAKPQIDASVVLDASALRDASASPDAGVDFKDARAPDAAPTPDTGPVDSGVSTLGQWSPRRALPAARQETAVVALNGQVYVIGGFDAQRNIVATVEAYNPESDTWRSIADLPVRLHHANAAAAAGRVCVVGYLSNGSFSAVGRVFCYDPGTDQWGEGEAMPAGSERGGSATAAIGGKIYVAGGQDGSRSSELVSVYDPTQNIWTALPSMPNPRNHIVAGAVDGKLYVIGGRSGGIRGHNPEVYAFDPANPSWVARRSMPTSRAGHAAAVVRGRIFVMGGEGNPAPNTSGVFAETEAYDPSTDQWSIMSLMRTPRHGTGAAAVGDRIYMPGGATVQAFGVVTINEVFIAP